MNSLRQKCLGRILWLILIGASVVSAQEIGPIEADRPDQTETASVVPRDHIQIESGFSFERTNGSASSFAHPSVLCKYGIQDFFEIRLVWELASYSANQRAATGLTPVAVGFKVRLLDETGITPTASLIGHISVPHLASAEFKASYYAPSARLALQHTLSESMSLGYNLGVEWDGASTEPIYLYSLVAGFSLDEALGCYAELYGFGPLSERSEHLADAGLTYLLRQNMMVDISAGVGITSNAPDFFLAVGLSFRLWD